MSFADALLEAQKRIAETVPADTLVTIPLDDEAPKQLPPVCQAPQQVDPSESTHLIKNAKKENEASCSCCCSGLFRRIFSSKD